MVALLDRIMGDRSSFKLEERLFHFYTFLGCLFCLSGLIPNTLTGMSPYLNFVTALLGFSFGLVYWFSRSKKSSAKHLILPHCLLTTVLLPILFLLNGGIVSSIPIDIVSVVQYFALVIQPRWITLILFLGIIVAYFILDLFHLSWIIPYPNEFSQKIDIYLTLLFMGLITFGACSILLREYDRERGLLINKTKELEDYKKESEQLNLLEIKAQELAKLGYWELDLNTNKIKWSEGTYKIFDRDPNLGVLTLENLMNMVHPDDRQKMEQLFQKAVVEGIPYNLEKRIILENGKTKTVKVITEVGKDENDRVVKLFGVIQDITDRKQMEDKLRHNQAILAEAQRIAKVGYWEYNLADSSIAWSEQTFIIFGFAPDQKTPSWSEVEQRIHPDDRELHAKVLEEAITKGRPYKIELRIILPDNSLRYVEAIAKTEIVDGKTVKLFGSVLDITDRKLAEQALEKSKKQLLEAQRIAHLGSWELDFKTTQWTWSPELFNIYGLNPSLGEPTYAEYLEMLQPEERERLDQALQKAISTGESLLLETKFLRSDGVLKYLEIRGEHIITGVGSPICLLGTVLDITDRVKMEKALQESEVRFRNLANNIPGVILRHALHPDGKDELIYISPGCYHILGVKPEEALADVNKFWETVVLEDIVPLRESILLSAQNLSLWRHDWRICTKSGELKWISGVGIPTREDNGDVVWDTIITDVTDRKRTQAELEKLVQKRTIELQKSQKFLEEQLEKEKELIAIIQTELKQKETLLKEVHHRVKNNLQIITSLMRLQHDKHQDPALKLSFQESQSRIQAMALIHESLYRSDNLSEINTPIYLQELAEYLGQIYNAKNRNITISLDISDIMLDIDRAIPCGLIVNELLSNSLKYAFVDKPSGTITISLHQLGSDYLLQIRDNGIGLPEDFNIRRSPSLGLRLVDRLVKQLRGHLEIGYDRGAVFSILFPL
jgi:PAS domain S-box-containing protein